MAIEHARENYDWYRYIDHEEVERYVCHMGECGFHIGWTHIGALNHHMMPEHGLKATTKPRSATSVPPTPPPCITRSATKAGRNKLAKSYGVPPLNQHIYAKSRVPAKSDGGRRESRRRGGGLQHGVEGRHESTAKKDRQVFQEAKTALLEAIRCLESITATKKVGQKASTTLKRSHVMETPTAKKLGPLCSALYCSDVDCPSRKRCVNLEVNDCAPPRPCYKTPPRAGPEIPSRIGNVMLIPPHIGSSFDGGLNAAQHKSLHDMDERQKLIHAIARKLLRPIPPAPPASLEMVRLRREMQKRKPVLELPTTVPLSLDNGQPSSAVHVASECKEEENTPDAAMDGESNGSPEGEENSPIRYSKCVPNYLIVSAKQSIREVIEIDDGSPLTQFDIDRPSPIRHPRGGSIRRPLMLGDSPIHERNTIHSMHRDADPKRSAINMMWENTGKSQTVMIKAPRLYHKRECPELFDKSHETECALATSPPSVNLLLKDIADSADAQMLGCGPRSCNSTGIEDILGQVDNITANAVPTKELSKSKGKGAIVAYEEDVDQICNLSTQTMKWILDGLDSTMEGTGSEKRLENYASDTGSD